MALTFAGCSGTTALVQTGGSVTSPASEEGGAAGPSETERPSTIRIGVSFLQPGVGFLGHDDHEGFDIDLARFVAGQLGYSEEDIEWVEAPALLRQSLLLTDTVDMVVASYSITPEREAAIDFAGPYFVAGQDLLVRADDESITGPLSLTGKTVCTTTGAAAHQRISERFGQAVELVERSSYAHCIDSMLAGEVDAVSTDDHILAGLAQTPKYRGKVRLVGELMSIEEIGIGLQPGSALCEPVSEAITEWISSGQWRESLDANFGENALVLDDAVNPPAVAPCSNAE
jgi:glutamate transport system substrate-binding protein